MIAATVCGRPVRIARCRAPSRSLNVCDGDASASGLSNSDNGSVLLSSRAGGFRRRINLRSENPEVPERRAYDEPALFSSGPADEADAPPEVRSRAAVSLSRSGAEDGTPFACAPPDRNDCSCRTESVSSAGDDSSFGFEGATLVGLIEAEGGATLRAPGWTSP